jgi:hypothetical protein
MGSAADKFWRETDWHHPENQATWAGDRFITEMYFDEEDIEKMDSLCYLAHSKIDGWGLFAKKDMPANTVVGYFHGPQWNGNGDDKFVYWAGPDNTIPIMVVGPMRFVNHSPEPNLEVEEFDPPYSLGACQLKTMRPIRAGEEFTWHYGEEFEAALKEEECDE